MEILGLVLHLPRATARRPVAERLSRDCGVPCEVIEAVDGAALGADAVAAACRPGLHAPGYPFALRPGEIGCFLSHRTAWARLVDSGADAALVFEDDAVLDATTFFPALTLARRHVKRLGFIQLQTRPVAGTALDAEGAAQLFLPAVTPLRASGQLVHRDAARRLLDLTAPFDRPVDTFLQMHWLTGVRLATIYPAGLSDATVAAGGSTISQRKSLPEKIAREWKRARYRAITRRLSEKHA